MPGADRFKFGLEGHPIEQEGRKRRLEPTPEFKAKQVKAERELLKNAVGDERELFREVLNKIEAKELIDKISDKVDQDYIHDFRNWIVGIGKRSDYIKAGVPLTSVGQAKPLSRHKSVIDFVDKLTGRVVDYYAEIVNMKMRGPGVGRHGGPATLNDLWLYFKYVVRNDPIDPKDFMHAEDLKGTPDAAVVGNRDGITDEPTEAPSMPDRDFGAEDKRMRAAPPDTQTRRKAAPKAHLDAIADKAATGDGSGDELDGGAPPTREPSPERKRSKSTTVASAASPAPSATPSTPASATASPTPAPAAASPAGLAPSAISAPSAVSATAAPSSGSSPAPSSGSPPATVPSPVPPTPPPPAVPGAASTPPPSAAAAPSLPPGAGAVRIPEANEPPMDRDSLTALLDGMETNVASKSEIEYLKKNVSTKALNAILRAVIRADNSGGKAAAEQELQEQLDAYVPASHRTLSRSVG